MLFGFTKKIVCAMRFEVYTEVFYTEIIYAMPFMSDKIPIMSFY